MPAVHVPPIPSLHGVAVPALALRVDHCGRIFTMHLNGYPPMPTHCPCLGSIHRPRRRVPVPGAFCLLSSFPHSALTSFLRAPPLLTPNLPFPPKPLTPFTIPPSLLHLSFASSLLLPSPRLCLHEPHADLLYRTGGRLPRLRPRCLRRNRRYVLPNGRIRHLSLALLPGLHVLLEPQRLARARPRVVPFVPRAWTSLDVVLGVVARLMRLVTGAWCKQTLDRWNGEGRRRTRMVVGRDKGRIEEIKTDDVRRATNMLQCLASGGIPSNKRAGGDRNLQRCMLVPAHTSAPMQSWACARAPRVWCNVVREG
ncbi:hypothetical protein B0H16DRAFT_1569995, partial [Mycena metata]